MTIDPEERAKRAQALLAEFATTVPKMIELSVAEGEPIDEETAMILFFATAYTESVMRIEALEAEVKVLKGMAHG